MLIEGLFTDILYTNRRGTNEFRAVVRVWYDTFYRHIALINKTLV